MIYLDNSATTKPYSSVLTSFQRVSESFFANPSSIHQLGGEAEKLLLKAKVQAADLLDVARDEVIFTSGGTEGNNIAIKGVALEHHARGKHIITSVIEHPSVMEACKSLEAFGFETTFLPVDENGVVSLKDVTQAIRDDTILISIMHVNNEIGSIQPIKEIGEIAKRHAKIIFHVDNVQGLGKIPLSIQNSGIDICTMSGHKIHGLVGTGMLYINNRIRLFPLFHGGNQERSIRSGTENLAGAVAMVKALRLITERQHKELDKMYVLQNYLLRQLAEIDGVVVNTPAHVVPHIVNISVPGLKPEVMIHMLGEEDIYISTKSACSSKEKDESSVLAACGKSKECSTSALRISMSYDTNKSDLTTFLQALKMALTQFKKAME